MKKYLLLSVFCLLTVSIFARETVNLNHSWKFTPGSEVQKNVFTTVNLPHTYNLDALSGKADYFRGLVNYEKDVEIPAEWKEKKVYIRFKGVNSIANVFINGKHAGEHRGGYTAFVYDISDMLKYGEKNTVWVRVTNALVLDILPLLGDFNMYGGIYRDVDFIITEKEHIALTDYASTGVYVKQLEVNKNLAKTETVVKVSGENNQRITVRVNYKDAEGKVVAKAETSTATKENELVTLNLPIELKKPRLWNGQKDPYLYTVEAEILKNGVVIDKVVEKTGFRYFNVDPNKGFFLNGEHLQLKGVCRHQDREGLGNALYPVHHEEDIALIREMGSNSIRLSHYPQDKYVHQLSDKYGLVLWAEIPLVGPGGYRDKGFVNQESFKENGKQQLIELIRQNFNHPSICFWGLFNELNQRGDDPYNYLVELNELAKKEDPSRITTSASNISGNINEVSEIVAWNLYFGWYGGEPSSLKGWAENTHKQYPNRAIGVSEYGAGASIYHQQEELKKPEAGSYWHPENWQTYFHEEHWKVINETPYLWGTFIWNMFDFGAAHRTEGEIPGKNDKGLVTFDRKDRKDAFYFYKANWNKETPFVHIAEKRIPTAKDKRSFKIYSNCNEVELFINGKSQGKRKGNYGTFTWENISLKDGKIIVEAIGDKLNKDAFEMNREK